jgi:hypothetical protein
LQGGNTDERYHHTKTEADTHVFEAPADNGIYARYNGVWVKIGEVADSSSGAELFNIEDFDFDWNDITTGVSQTYILKVRASYSYRIVSVVLQSDTTMDDITIEINGNPITWEDGSISIDVTSTPLEKVLNLNMITLLK